MVVGSRRRNVSISLILLLLLDFAESLSKEERSKLRDGVELALEDVSYYMKRHADQLNLDGLTGLSMVKADLEELKETFNSYEWLKNVLGNIDAALLEGRQQVIAYDPEYYESLGKLTFADFWTPSRRHLSRGSTIPLWHVIDDLLKEGLTMSSQKETMDEDKSDACVEELLHQDGCNVSTECFNLMTAANSDGYSATHQVFYTLIMGQTGCLRERPESIMADFLRTTCAKIFLDASNIPLDSGIHKDLFMEQIGLCGLAGYWQEFSRTAWIEHIISWRRPSGCYGDGDNFLKELDTIEKNERFKRGVQSRKKREERIIDDGCLVHRTTVALLALSQNIRALLQLSE